MYFLAGGIYQADSFGVSLPALLEYFLLQEDCSESCCGRLAFT